MDYKRDEKDKKKNAIIVKVFHWESVCSNSSQKISIICSVRNEVIKIYQENRSSRNLIFILLVQGLARLLSYPRDNLSEHKHALWYVHDTQEPVQCYAGAMNN